MKVEFDERGRRAEIRIEVPEDLLHLSRILDPETRVEAETFRYEERRDDVQRSERPARRRMRVVLRPQRVEFDEFGRLRILGVIEEGELAGKHHSLSLGVGSELVVEKERWRGWELEELRRAMRLAESPRILALVADDREVLLAVVTSDGVKILDSVERKGDEEIGDLMKKAIAVFGEELGRAPFVIAGVDAFHRLLQEEAESRGLRPLKVVQVHHGGAKGVYELLAGGGAPIFRELRFAYELQAIERLRERIYKDLPHALGREEVTASLMTCAAEEVIILDSMLHEARDLLEMAERCRARVTIITSGSEAALALRALGGVAAILRF